MNNIENRIKKLEQHTGALDRRRDVKMFTDDELAVILTGKADAKASVLTDDDLKAVIDKYASEYPDTDIIRVVSQKAKELTKRLIAGEGME